MSTSFGHKWKLDMSTKNSKRCCSNIVVNFAATTISRSSHDGYNPPGYSPAPAGAHHAVDAATRVDTQQQQHLLTKRAWEMALAPVKQLPMNMFIMYMAGNTISIFPIMMVCMMAWRPVKALMSVQTTFKVLDEDEHIGTTLVLQKIVYVLGNVLAIALAVYKCHSMGLLPTHASDWLDFVAAPARVQFGVGTLLYT